MADDLLTAGVRGLVARALGVPQAGLTPSTDLREDAGADEDGIILALMMIEEAYGAELPDTAPDLVTTAGDVVRLTRAAIGPVC